MQITTEQLWHSLSGQMLSFIRNRIRSEEDAKDLLNEVFLRIHEKLPDLRDTEKMTAWIYRITRNAIVDHYKRKKETSLDDEESLANDAQLSDNYQEMSKCLHPFLSRLQPREQYLVNEIEIKGRKQTTLATELGLSYPTLKSQLQRARKKIKGLFLECCHFEFDKKGRVAGRVLRGEVCPICCP